MTCRELGRLVGRQLAAVVPGRVNPVFLRCRGVAVIAEWFYRRAKWKIETAEPEVFPDTERALKFSCLQANAALKSAPRSTGMESSAPAIAEQ